MAHWREITTLKEVKDPNIEVAVLPSDAPQSINNNFISKYILCLLSNFYFISFCSLILDMLEVEPLRVHGTNDCGVSCAPGNSLNSFYWGEWERHLHGHPPSLFLLGFSLYLLERKQKQDLFECF